MSDFLAADLRKASAVSPGDPAAPASGVGQEAIRALIDKWRGEGAKVEFAAMHGGTFYAGVRQVFLFCAQELEALLREAR